MQDDIDADFIRILRPRGILRGLLYLLHLRMERVQAQQRGDTIASVAAVLSDCGRDGSVISRQGDDEWSVTVGAETTPSVMRHKPEVR